MGCFELLDQHWPNVGSEVCIRTQYALRLGCSRLWRSGSETAPLPREPEADEQPEGRLVRPARLSPPPPCGSTKFHTRHTASNPRGCLR
ncbi:unnamed protein product, partial [Iphiclides podalirius]